MITFTVLHDTSPTYEPNENLRAPSAQHVPVACGRTYGQGDLEVCEMAFRFTNTIETDWVAQAAQRGLENVVRSRSTSIGDIVRIVDDAGERHYLCSVFGWSLMQPEGSDPGAVAPVLGDQ